MPPGQGNNADTGTTDVGVHTVDAGHNGVMAESSESSAPPLVLLHAFPLDARMWDPVRGRLAAWTRVITPDLRGFGRTELPLSDRSPDLADAAADVVAMLDGLGLQRVVLGGCSMGGYVAMAVLRKAPERVAGVVLLDTKAEADGEQARQNRHRVAERAEREGVRDWLAAEMLGSLLGDSTRTHHVDVMEHTRDLIDAQQPSGVAWAQRAMANRPDSTETLRATTVPALVLVGAEDVLTGPGDARRMTRELQDSSLVTVSAAGHLAPLEAPGEVAGAITDWLAGFDAAAGAQGS